LTARENVALCLEINDVPYARRARAGRLLDYLGLSHRVNAYPDEPSTARAERRDGAIPSAESDPTARAERVLLLLARR
jgi:predicted ABC-type transport system involved in lysophospholipase L1 biosynthesis ATPase subunit